MIGAFRSFLDEVQKEYPHSFDGGDFSDLADMLVDLSNQTTDAGIRISDVAVKLSREGSPIARRLAWLETLKRDLEHFGSPEAVCTHILDHERTRS